MAVGQNQWYHFGVGAPPILVYLSGDWDVHWGYELDFDPWPNEILSRSKLLNRSFPTRLFDEAWRTARLQLAMPSSARAKSGNKSRTTGQGNTMWG